jgi:hypothetical protein
MTAVYFLLCYGAASCVIAVVVGRCIVWGEE